MKDRFVNYHKPEIRLTEKQTLRTTFSIKTNNIMNTITFFNLLIAAVWLAVLFGVANDIKNQI